MVNWNERVSQERRLWEKNNIPKFRPENRDIETEDSIKHINAALSVFENPPFTIAKTLQDLNENSRYWGGLGMVTTSPRDIHAGYKKGSFSVSLDCKEKIKYHGIEQDVPFGAKWGSYKNRMDGIDVEEHGFLGGLYEQRKVKFSFRNIKGPSVFIEFYKEGGVMKPSENTALGGGWKTYDCRAHEDTFRIRVSDDFHVGLNKNYFKSPSSLSPAFIFDAFYLNTEHSIQISFPADKFNRTELKEFFIRIFTISLAARNELTLPEEIEQSEKNRIKLQSEVDLYNLQEKGKYEDKNKGFFRRLLG
jgi:hypothetical protein